MVSFIGFWDWSVILLFARSSNDMGSLRELIPDPNVNSRKDNNTTFSMNGSVGVLVCF